MLWAVCCEHVEEEREAVGEVLRDKEEELGPLPAAAASDDVVKDGVDVAGIMFSLVIVLLLLLLVSGGQLLVQSHGGRELTLFLVLKSYNTKFDIFVFSLSLVNVCSVVAYNKPDFHKCFFFFRI